MYLARKKQHKKIGISFLNDMNLSNVPFVIVA